MSVDQDMNDAIRMVAQAKVAEALGGEEGMLAKMVSAVMEHRDSSYRGDNKTALERIVDVQIHNLLTDVVREQIKALRPQFTEAVSAALKERADAFAAVILDGFANDDWRAELNVTVKRDRE